MRLAECWVFSSILLAIVMRIPPFIWGDGEMLGLSLGILLPVQTSGERCNATSEDLGRGR